MGAFIRDIFPLLIPIMALLIPVIAILTTHQQKMARTFAELRHRDGDPQVDALRREVAELKSLMHQQAIAIDNLVSSQTRANSDLRDRISL